MYDEIQLPLLSLADICRKICELTGAEIIQHEDRYITYACSGFLYSRNFILNVSESELEPVLKEIRANRAQGLPADISFTKERMPKGFPEIFERNGFQPFIRQTGMVFDLDQDFSREHNPDVAVISDAQIMEWSAAVANGFPKPREDAPFIALNKSDKVLTYGYMDAGQIASTGMLLMDSRLSGIHEVSTQKPFRGKGHAKAIVLRILQDLKAHGITRVSLQASDLGKQYVYGPLGFEAVSTVLTWVPAG